MKIIKGGVTKPQGFVANGLNCGIKRSGKPDLSLIFSPTPCHAVGVFTKNSVIAAPLVVTKAHLRNNKAQAVICNSGNANCFTGDFGLLYAERMAEKFAQELKIKPQDVLVASTGIIGKALPIKKILDSANDLVKGLRVPGGLAAAKGILTTDTRTKEQAVQVKIGGRTVTIGACAKGSGMIEPNMATMLGFVTTDAVISVGMLKKALHLAVEKSFNRITVDGCMSTNDMVTVMANGLAGNPRIDKQGKNFRIFVDALMHVCLELAKMIVRDGEGATKFVTIKVLGAPTDKIAVKAAKAVANSDLVRTAAYGSNPNWGRVAAAVGALGLNVTEKDLKIEFSSFKKRDISILIDLQKGKSTATVYTCDLSLDYVRINGKYN